LKLHQRLLRRNACKQRLEALAFLAKAHQLMGEFARVMVRKS
jgi:hypothetical protein